ncbi:MAG: RdgB/HAM1 family non-canonical purine NTP pyrophosphatase [Bdellovibrionales bacterium]
MELWIASSNTGKIKEFQNLLYNFPQVQIHTQNEISGFHPAEETGDSFLANARLKARALRSVKNQHWVLAEDSGLEVTGLNNLPGIHSARYAGPKARDSENVAKLMKMMQIRQVSDRSAQFRATLVVFTPTGEEWIFEGQMKGQIAPKVAGQNGFGYDPIFIPEGQTKTLAELDPGFKNRLSHRALAFKAFLEKVKTEIS